MKQVISYQTVDGRIHDSQELALKHLNTRVLVELRIIASKILRDLNSETTVDSVTNLLKIELVSLQKISDLLADRKLDESSS